MSDLERILKLAGAQATVEQTPSPAPEMTQREMKPVAQEAVGEFAEPIYDLIDMHFEGDCQPVFDDLVRYLSGDQIEDFVADFRRNHDLNDMGEDGDYGDDDENFGEADVEEATGVCKDCGCEIDNCKPGCDCPHDSHDAAGDHWVAEAKAKPDFADIDGDGDKDEDMKKAAKDKEELEESPTMDTTQLVTMMKNAGLSEEAISEKLNEWANTPEGAAEEESTVYAEPYELAQSVNLSLKRYLDAESMKVGIKEHTVEDLKEAYKAKKSK